MLRHHLRRAAAGTVTIAGVIGVVLAGGCTDKAPPVGPDTIPVDTVDTIIPPPPPPLPLPPAILLAAGDIADCRLPHDSLTALLLDAVPDSSAQGWPVVVAPLGDNVYDNGTDTEYANCYAPNWGRHRYRSRPAPGNHDYNTPGATGYYNYFGLLAGPAGKGWYSYDIGRWHIVVLNSNWHSPTRVDNSANSEQMNWLRADLAATTKVCQAVYFHHPHFSSSNRTADTGMVHAWRIMYAAGVELVLNGHDHAYERFAPMDADGDRDDAWGVRQITSGMAGTGATGGTPFGAIHRSSEARQNTVTGILKVTLDSTFYRWEFVSAPGRGPYTDEGRTDCHGPRPMSTAQYLGRAGRRLLDMVNNSQQPTPVLWPDTHEHALRRSSPSD